ncbi:MAG: peptide chain release factor 1 [Clostridiales bacterium]|nr:peptide chain release factor 1 [Clostridiales bacterium]
MFQKLDEVEKRYEFLNEQISDPEVIANNEVWRKYMKEHSDITDVVNKYREYKQTKNNIEEAKQMLNDPELAELAQMELDENKSKLPQIEEELKILLLPKDPNDDKNVIIEIRGGAGGDEAALFAHDLFRMYSMFAERKRWKVEILNINETGIGGIKEVSFLISGKGAYSKLKFESGVHRVQRVPDTESSGRIHTSTVTVAVLPELDDVDIDFEIRNEDMRIDTFRASGAGGQHVNKTESAIRITYLPTGLVVECQNERSQLQNKETALKMLRAKLYEQKVQEQTAQVAQDRKTQVGSGDRSEKIRTYNFPQGRITDHRINLSIYQMENFLNGDLDEMIDALNTQDMALKLQSGE